MALLNEPDNAKSLPAWAKRSKQTVDAPVRLLSVLWHRLALCSGPSAITLLRSPNIGSSVLTSAGSAQSVG
jgi:hypothetical protein